MPSLDWKNWQELLLGNGGYPHSIVAEGLKLEQWQRYYGFLRKTEAHLALRIDGQPQPLPTRLEQTWFDPAHETLLELGLAGVRLTCLLTDPAHLQLDFAPETIDTPERWVLLLRIISTLSRRLRVPVYLLHGGDGAVLFHYNLGDGFVLDSIVA